jgi:hypothetical protein
MCRICLFVVLARRESIAGPGGGSGVKEVDELMRW